MTIPERLPRETGREFALRALKENIISLGLAPGCRISENELALQLGLSRTPVREALLKLEKARLVELAPQRAGSVARIDYDLLEESSFLRRTLEIAVVGLACAQVSPAQLDALRENVSQQECDLAAGCKENLLALDNAFHRELFLIAGKEQTYRLMTGLTAHFDRVRGMSIESVADLEIVGDHRVICEAVARGDEKTARRVMETHLNRYRVDREALMKRYPASFFKAIPYNSREG